ncbi:protein Niban 1-like [Scyliorhinus canicula]|uniref:protein Niban 1-like n=1 Tax=Scyliorhinus canicula TaxID=7830 RepID=UPI0018F36212|nr:protein Niban 1-like [Scyliorhinus canicula]
MGLNFSTQLDNRMLEYLKGRADVLLNDVRPHCREQYAAAFLNKVWNEVEPRPSQSPQLLKNKVLVDTQQVIAQGYLMQHVENRKKWKECYFVMKASYHLEYYETKEAEQRKQKPEGSVLLSGYILLNTMKDYRDMLHRSWPHFNGIADTSWEEQCMNCPSGHPLFLWHRYRPHLLLCCHSADDQDIWSTLLSDAIRHLNTVIYRRDSFEVRAFLEAVRMYRQQKGQYGICDLYLGSETEILSNLVMEDLCPVLESQLVPHVRGPESKRKPTWLKMIGEMYAMVEAQITEGFQTMLRENEEQSLHLEKTVRPDFNQILTSKKQLVKKIQASFGDRVRWCCEEQVRPHLTSVGDRVAVLMKTSLLETRRLFSEEVSRVISLVKSKEHNYSSLIEACRQLQRLPYQSVQMHRCYENTETLTQSLSELPPRFAFAGDRFFTQRAQTVINQLLQDAVYTFQHLLLSAQTAGGLSAEINQLLNNTRVRVLKKLDSDSTAAVRQFVRDSLLEIFLPYVLKTLEPFCKAELPTYEAYLSADDDDGQGVIQAESAYNELVLHIVSGEINKGTLFVSESFNPLPMLEGENSNTWI